MPSIRGHVFPTIAAQSATQPAFAYSESYSILYGLSPSFLWLSALIIMGIAACLTRHVSCVSSARTSFADFLRITTILDAPHSVISNLYHMWTQHVHGDCLYQLGTRDAEFSSLRTQFDTLQDTIVELTDAQHLGSNHALVLEVQIEKLRQEKRSYRVERTAHLANIAQVEGERQEAELKFKRAERTSMEANKREVLILRRLSELEGQAKYATVAKAVLMARVADLEKEASSNITLIEELRDVHEKTKAVFSRCQTEYAVTKGCFNREVRRCKNANDTLALATTRITELDGRIDRRDQKCSVLRSKIVCLKDEIVDLKKTLRTATLETKELSDDNRHLFSDLTASKFNASSLRNKIVSLEEKLRAESSRALQLSKDSVQLVSNLASADIAADEATAKIDDLQCQLRRSAEDLTKETDLHKRTHDSMLSSQQQCAELSEKTDMLSLEISHAVQAHDLETAKLATAARHVTSRDNQIELMEKACKSLAALTTSAIATIDSKEKEISVLQTKADSLVKANADLAVDLELKEAEKVVLGIRAELYKTQGALDEAKRYMAGWDESCSTHSRHESLDKSFSVIHTEMAGIEEVLVEEKRERSGELQNDLRRPLPAAADIEHSSDSEPSRDIQAILASSKTTIRPGNARRTSLPPRIDAVEPRTNHDEPFCDRPRHRSAPPVLTDSLVDAVYAAIPGLENEEEQFYPTKFSTPKAEVKARRAHTAARLASSAPQDSAFLSRPTGNAEDSRVSQSAISHRHSRVVFPSAGHASDHIDSKPTGSQAPPTNPVRQTSSHHVRHSQPCPKLDVVVPSLLKLDIPFPERRQHNRAAASRNTCAPETLAPSSKGLKNNALMVCPLINDLSYRLAARLSPCTRLAIQSAPTVPTSSFRQVRPPTPHRPRLSSSRRGDLVSIPPMWNRDADRLLWPPPPALKGIDSDVSHSPSTEMGDLFEG